MSKLTLVPTPIGNLKDITLRALDVLRSVDGVLAEDTRTTGFLLKHYEISQKLSSFHAHNEHTVVSKIVARIQSGEHLALVSDAGTPGISDPGFLLVRACIAAGIEVECLPGPTALVLGIVQSGFATDRFVFEGFLPLKKGRQKRLESLAEEERTMVFYESPHRIAKALAQMRDVFGAERLACLSRELTKKFEENIRGSLSELAEIAENRNLKGEMVIIIKGYEK